MASYVSNHTLNLAADQATNRTVEVRVHSGAPGNAGTGNRIGTVSEDVAAGGWTAAASGVSETTGDTEFGVLSTSQSNTVTAYSLWDGANFMGWADLAADIVVAANESFTLSAGTVEFEFARP